MVDPITIEALAARRRKDERDEALAKCQHYLSQMLYYQHALGHTNHLHQLQLEVPSEKQITDAITQCARIKQLDRGN